MAKNPVPYSRRRIIKLSLLGLSALPVAGLMRATVRDAAAADLPQLDENDPTAQSFGYKHDASQVDTDKFPKRKQAGGADQLCSNCQLYTAGPDAQWGPCSIFPGKSVNADGWCNAWIPKSG